MKFQKTHSFSILMLYNKQSKIKLLTINVTDKTLLTKSLIWSWNDNQNDHLVSLSITIVSWLLFKWKIVYEIHLFGKKWRAAVRFRYKFANCLVFSLVGCSQIEWIEWIAASFTETIIYLQLIRHWERVEFFVWHTLTP